MFVNYFLIEKMLRLFLIFFLVNFHIFANNFETNFQATVAAEPSVMLEGCVNLMTGQLYINDVDIIAEGKEPIYFSKSYSSMFSAYSLDDIIDRWSEIEDAVNGGWGGDKHVMTNIGYDLERKKDNLIRTNRRVDVYDPNGTMLSFEFPQVKPPKKKFWDSKEEKKEKKQEFEDEKAKTRPLKLIENQHFYQRAITNAKDNYKNTTAKAHGEHNLRVKSASGAIRHYYRKDAAFGPYSLEWEILPNGNKLEYIIKDKELEEIKSKSPSGKIYARLTLNKTFQKDKTIVVETNSKKTIKYEYKKEKIKNEGGVKKRKTFLGHKTSPYGDEHFEYHKNKFFLLKTCIYPKNRLFQIEYYDNYKKKEWKRVSELKSYLGKAQNLKTLYRIYYEQIPELNKTKGQTTLIDANGNQTKYFFSTKLRLEGIERFENINGGQKFKNFEAFIWRDNGFFLGQIYINEHRQRIKAIRNIYDGNNGNIISKITYGNISGKCNKSIELGSDNLPIDNGIEMYVKNYTYSNNNQIKSEIDQNSYGTEYTYLTMKIHGENFETSLPLTKFTIFNSEIKKRNFYSYDSDNVLIEEIEDNGVSTQKENLESVTRRIIKRIAPQVKEPYGFAECIKEYYYDIDEKIEKFLKKEKYEYSKSCKVIKKHVFGSDDELKYTLNYEYDPRNDNLISETDPLGRKAFYNYDENSNKIYEKTFANKEIYFEYDLCNRLVSKTIKDNKQNYIEEYEYDARHNKISQKDFYGNITRLNYDSLGNVIEEISPKTEDCFGKASFSKKCYEYDAFSRQIKKTDEMGNSTNISYNIFDQPIKIEYQDETTEEFEYNLDGTLKHHIDQIKTKIEYTYDFLKRAVSKRIISPTNDVLSEEFFEYDVFNLISRTDPAGTITKYTYDGAGRKIKEEVFSKAQSPIAKEEFFYDELGFLEKTFKADLLFTIYKRDFLGRVLEEKQKDINSNDLKKVQLQYDDKENKKIIISDISGRESKETKSFDSLDRLIKVEDPLKNSTTYLYDAFYNEKLDQKSKRITAINSLKQKTIRVFDSLDRERIIENIDPNGSTISYEEKFYDVNGNLAKQVSSIYINPNEISKTITTIWQYDEMNRLTELTEAYGSKKSKTTEYSYTDKGLIEKIIKPDLNILSYEYDPLGNNTRIYSSKRDIDNRFEYNKLNQVVLTEDFENFITRRKYDVFGNILEEGLSNGLSISNEYDLLNNKIKTIFQDGSSVEYKYDPRYLKEIIRKDKNGFELYKHEYSNYDLAGNLLKENLILDSGDVEYFIDKLSRVTKIKTKFHDQQVEYDSIGRISNISWDYFLKDTYSYSYDDLNQIISEAGLFSNSYQFDSHNNRLLKNDDLYKVNDLHQVDANDDFEFEYDENGNLIKKTFSNGSVFYEYDSLDRLIKVTDPSLYDLEFIYDPFNRRISKISKYNSFFQLDDCKYFLYDGQNEIGSFDQNFNQKELRILSDTNKAEIGSAISFEIDGYIYAPLYDVSGNLVSLIYNSSLYEHYRYSVFGERKIFSGSGYEKKKSSINNPWQFSSKRIDEETNLIYYGRRYYDPILGRWITPDPQGFADGPNLYAFLLNDPLTRVDLYGLMMFPPMIVNQSYSQGNYFSENNFSLPQRSFDSKEFKKNIVNFFFEGTQTQKILNNEDPSRKINVGSNDFQDGRNIGATFGIRTSSQEAIEYGKIISNYSGGKSVHLLHNETRGGFWDVSRAGCEGVFHKETKSVKMQKEIWTDYLLKSDKNYLHICHSEGAIITRNALEGTDPNLRNRIDVLAFAPAAYIDKDLCHSREHYVGRDFVPYLDLAGYARNIDSIVRIKPHPNAKRLDHNFNSPSYDHFLLEQIKNYAQ
ncbi:MAG: putative deoxyribonuclease RhsA [Candidatus Anoxychlamydiales bacterium]|nr:putative deoxyribonuclease RhsA [Candidatus Anoxychlamydiales bacterium]